LAICVVVIVAALVVIVRVRPARPGIVTSVLTSGRVAVICAVLTGGAESRGAVSGLLRVVRSGGSLKSFRRFDQMATVSSVKAATTCNVGGSSILSS
jgi:hypothetical protein